MTRVFRPGKKKGRERKKKKREGTNTLFVYSCCSEGRVDERRGEKKKRDSPSEIS